MEESVKLKLTKKDILRYEARIAEVDIDIEQELIMKIQSKVESMLQMGDLSTVVISLVQDISKLLRILREAPDLPDSIKRKIIFALQYFYDPEDEIPDNLSGLGFLDDAIVVKWVVDQVVVKYPNYFQA